MEKEEVLTWDGGNGGNPTIGPELSAVQKREMGELLWKYKSSLTKVPGCTDLVRHTIKFGMEVPFASHRTGYCMSIRRL